MKTKIKKNYLYLGLGFPIILSQVTLQYMHDEWMPKIDVYKIAAIAFSLMPSKPSRLTGREVSFIRKHLKLNKSNFAKTFSVSHTAVSKWEKTKFEVSPMSLTQEKILRLYVMDYLEPKAKDFYSLYKDLDKVIAKKSAPKMKIAV